MFLVVSFVGASIFGIILLADGDWLPGGIIVAASLTGLAVKIPVIRGPRLHTLRAQTKQDRHDARGHPAKHDRASRRRRSNPTNLVSEFLPGDE
jgi:hypothetical protein